MFRLALGDIEAVLGAELVVDWCTVSRLESPVSTGGAGATFGAFSVMGGGRFFPPAVGAWRVATGASTGTAGGGRSGSGSAGGVGGVCSCRALKLRFLRMGVAIVEERVV